MVPDRMDRGGGDLERGRGGCDHDRGRVPCCSSSSCRATVACMSASVTMGRMTTLSDKLGIVVASDMAGGGDILGPAWIKEPKATTMTTHMITIASDKTNSRLHVSMV